MYYAIKWIAWILVVIGGINWGLIGFFDYNLVQMLFGAGTMATKIVYDVVGLSSLVLICFKIMKMKGKKMRKK
ncbi:DUF378 domain-containing protein [Candidatus Pacearchaeota archaeon]|jgi:hypothetical protein|nr:DUF378 domain-containing protein [Candidatus Pacearchaeota archaeon]